MQTTHPAAGAPARPGAPILMLVSEADPVTRLTRREREVLALIAEGYTNQAICRSLFIAPKTLERHVQNVFLKLDLPPDAGRHRRVSAVLAWLRSPLSADAAAEVFPAAAANAAG